MEFTAFVFNHEGRKFHGVGLATDIVESSALALVHAINAIYRAHKVADIKNHNQRVGVFCASGARAQRFVQAYAELAGEYGVRLTAI